MTDRVCKNCVHWERDTYEFRYGNNVGDCDSPKFIYKDECDPADDALHYWDSEGYSASFNTGENFGCIHWEGK